MQRFYLLLTLFMFLFLASSVLPAIGQDESQEPPLSFVVKVDDQSLTLGEGETAQIDGAFTNPKVTVTPQPYRVFPYQGVSFKYPRSFAFGADLVDPNEKIWTLSGNDLTVMYFVMNAELTTDDYAESMMDEVGAENCEVLDEEAQITLGEEKLTGKKIRISVAEQEVVMEIYQVPARESVTKFLIFQDTPDESGNRSKEYVQAIKEIKSSFKVEKE
jgi:hypothetical protein